MEGTIPCVKIDSTAVTQSLNTNTITNDRNIVTIQNNVAKRNELKTVIDLSNIKRAMEIEKTPTKASIGQFV